MGKLGYKLTTERVMAWDVETVDSDSLGRSWKSSDAKMYCDERVLSEGILQVDNVAKELRDVLDGHFGPCSDLLYGGGGHSTGTYSMHGFTKSL